MPAGLNRGAGGEAVRRGDRYPHLDRVAARRRVAEFYRVGAIGGRAREFGQEELAGRVADRAERGYVGGGLVLHLADAVWPRACAAAGAGYCFWQLILMLTHITHAC